MGSDSQSTSTYTLYRRGLELLADDDYRSAVEPLAQAARRAPEKTSVREALGRAYYRSGLFPKAAAEFEAVIETYHANDYAHFCLGRALTNIGETDRARHHLAIAAGFRPERDDYRYHLERLSPDQ